MPLVLVDLDDYYRVDFRGITYVLTWKQLQAVQRQMDRWDRDNNRFVDIDAAAAVMDEIYELERSIHEKLHRSEK